MAKASVAIPGIAAATIWASPILVCLSIEPLLSPVDGISLNCGSLAESVQIFAVKDLVLNRLYRGAGERNGGGGDEWNTQTECIANRHLNLATLAVLRACGAGRRCSRPSHRNVACLKVDAGVL